jgi:hypothetical protein
VRYESSNFEHEIYIDTLETINDQTIRLRVFGKHTQAGYLSGVIGLACYHPQFPN